MTSAEEEQYYDSIDDSEFESCRSFCNAKFEENDSDLEDNIKIESLIPFYNGNVELDSIKNDSISNSCTNLKSKLKRRNNKYLIPTLERRKNRSYLTIFYAKSGLQSKSGIPDSSQAGTELTPKSCISSDQDENTSCYFNQTVDDSERYTKREKSRDNYRGGNQSAACMPQSELTSNAKLYSVSEVQLNPVEEPKKDLGFKLNKNKMKAKPVRASELGGLGPNIAQEKLELLRKRQDYGRIVSQKNRLKFMESKVVQKLRDEIRENNKFQ